MTRAKQHFWLTGIFLLFFLPTNATNSTFPTVKLESALMDSVIISTSSVSGTEGSNVSVEVSVRNFVNVKSLNFSINWATPFLEYLDTSNLISGLSNASFNMSQKSNGGFSVTFTPNSNTLPDGTVLLKINYKILRCVGFGIPIFVSDLPKPILAISLSNTEIPVTSRIGKVNVAGTGCGISRPAGLTCQAAPLLCPAEFPYTAVLTESGVGTRPDNTKICFAANDPTSINNNAWLSFIAGSTDIVFNISAKLCTRTGEGVQIAILESSDCVNFEPVLDQSNNPSCVKQIREGVNEDKNFQCTNLVVGKLYYIMVDGYGGDLCSYEINIKSGSVLGSSNNSVKIESPTSVCKNGQNILFNVPIATGGLSYTWRVTNGNGTIASGQGTPSVKVNWGSVSDEVCVKIRGRCDDADEANIPWTCKSITVNPPKKGDLFRQICSGQTFIYKGISYATAGNFDINETSSDGCDSVTTLKLSFYAPSVKTQNTTICQGSSYTIGSNTYNLAGNYTVTLPNQAFTGCDSIINLNLTVLNLNATATKSGDLACGASTVTLIGAVSPSNTLSSVTYEWRDALNVVINTAGTPSVIVATAGTYTLKVTGVLNGITCTDFKSVTVSQSGTAPAKPQLNGAIEPCENVAITYNIINPQVSTYTWTIKNGSFPSVSTTSTISAVWGINPSGQICVKAVNACGVSDTSCLDVQVKKLPTVSDISSGAGGDAVCPNSNATYSVNSSPLITEYQWTIPSGATIVSGQTTPSITVSWGNSSGGSVCVTPKNSCGTGLQKCFAVTIKNAAPNTIPISGPVQVCPAESAKYSVTPDASITSYNWILPTGVTAISATNSSSIDVRFDSGSGGNIQLEIKNSCNLSTVITQNVQVKTTIPTALPIIGSTTVCSNDTTTYGVSGNASIISYAWNVPSGATIIAGQGTETIKIAWGTALNGIISLKLKNTCQLENTTQTNAINITDATLAKPVINGDLVFCPGSKVKYSTPLNPKIKTFLWTIPTGATILSGAGTNEIEVQWASTGGVISLQIDNNCNVKNSNSITIQLKNATDTLPLIGAIEVCEGSTANFTIQNDPLASSYFWTFPTGATKVSGGTSNNVVIKFGSTDGFVRVSPNGGCADGLVSKRFVKIKKIPTTPLSINGKNAVCQGDTAKYKVALTPNASSYAWTIPTGATMIANSDSMDEITVQWTSGTGGNLIVKAKNDCGLSSTDKTLAVVVNPKPTPFAGLDDNICGLDYTFKGTTSGGTLAWSVIQKPIGETAAFKDFTKSNTNVTVSKSGVYVFKIDENNNSCANSDTVQITFKSKPQLTIIDTSCNVEAEKYAVKISISGIAPFTSTGLAGTISGSSFLSQPILSGAAYSLVVKDASGCETTISGQKTCFCVTSAGSFKADSLVVCYRSSGRVAVPIDAVLDANDVAEFILHDGTSTATGNILVRNKTGVFDFDAATMLYNRKYFINFIVGNPSATNTVLATDRCFSSSKNSVSVVFKDKLTASMKGDTIICSATKAALRFDFNQDNTFRVVFKNGVDSTVLNNIKKGSKTDVTPSLSTVYRLFKVTDQFGCEAQFLDSVVTIRIRQKPVTNAGIDQTTCGKTGQLAAPTTPQYKGTWKSLGIAQVTVLDNPKSNVTGLQNGKNIFVWTLKDSVCSTYSVSDSISIFVPLTPKATNWDREIFAGDTISGNLSDQAPAGTYSVRRIEEPQKGYFSVFSNGTFDYVSDKTYTGVVEFRFSICGEACASTCDTGVVKIFIKTRPVVIDSIPKVIIPNAITPNDDGKNDFFVVDNLENFKQNELVIFNRWGDVLFQEKPYKNDWHGNNQRGEPLPEGTYYYVLRLNINDGKVLRGDITVLR